MVGAAILRALELRGCRNLLLRTRNELDLTDRAAVDRFFFSERPDYVFVAAAKVGGILANDTEGADFIRENLLIQTHVIDSAWRHGARKLLFLGSSCIYPKHAEQPIREDSLLTGELEPTNLPYAVAKIAGKAMCDAYRRQYGFDAFTVMPSNVYGVGDNFDPASSHVVAGLMRRFHEAKCEGAPEVSAWGTGSPLRELVDADDLADACVFLMENYSEGGLINAGSSQEISVRELTELMAEITGYQGNIIWDTSKPDGTPRKIMENSRLHAMGWRPKVTIREGLEKMYSWFCQTGGVRPSTGCSAPERNAIMAETPPAPAETEEVPVKENRITKAMRELGIHKKESERSSALLNTMLTHRKQQRQRDWNPRTRTLEGFFEFAISRVKNAQGQLFQDLWALYELEEKRGGYFVEFGATNGITMSNSHLLEHHFGWQGVCAEPNPDFHERLARERNCIISHKCVYSTTGDRMAFLCTEKAMFSRLEAINPEDHNEDSMRTNPNEIMVETVSLNDLLDEHNAPDEIDYMSVDTEGSELEILSAFNFEKRQVKLFTIEHNFTELRGHIYDLMTSKGYIRRFPEYTRFDDWYVHRDVAG